MKGADGGDGTIVVPADRERRRKTREGREFAASASMWEEEEEGEEESRICICHVPLGCCGRAPKCKSRVKKKKKVASQVEIQKIESFKD